MDTNKMELPLYSENYNIILLNDDKRNPLIAIQVRILGNQPYNVQNLKEKNRSMKNNEN